MKGTPLSDSQHLISDALFDSLFIVDRLQPLEQGATVGEVHAFSYLACLLSLFEGSPASAWGYSFSALPPTMPYAPAISDAVQGLETAGMLSRSANLYTLTSAGESECTIWSGLRQLEWRRRFLDGATGASLVVGVPAISNDLSREPQLQRALSLGQPRELLEPATLIPLFEQFEALRAAVGDEAQDLLTPAVVYLTFLASEDVSG